MVCSNPLIPFGFSLPRRIIHILTETCAIGDNIGLEMEQAFYAKAKQAGLTDEEAKSAFNSNMMSTGLLSEFPADFAREHSRRWLVSAYEAGDVVLHKPHMVSRSFLDNKLRMC